MRDYEAMRKWAEYIRRHEANVFNAIFYDREIVSEEEIRTIIANVAEFFALPAPAVNRQCKEMAQILVREEAKECELHYNLEMLTKAGINNRDAFTLCFVHEMAHQLLFHHRFMLFCCERWMQELAADLTAGLYAGKKGIATGKYKYVLSVQKANVTHPTGMLRKEIVDYGRLFLKRHQLNDSNKMQTVIKLLPAFVYSHYGKLKTDWHQVLHELEFPPPPPKSYSPEDLPESNLLKQTLLKIQHKKKTNNENNS